MTSPKRPNAGTKGVARPEREAQILAAACRAFGERGYAATSVADVAGSAGISKPLIYNYFGSKDGLHAACVRHASAALAEEIERTARTDTVGLARAVVTLDGMFRRLEGEPWLWKLVTDPSVPPDSALLREIADQQRRVLGFAREAVGELMRSAGDDDPVNVELMIAVWESVFRTLVTWWVDHPGETPEQMTHRCLQLIAAAGASSAAG